MILPHSRQLRWMVLYVGTPLLLLLLWDVGVVAAYQVFGWKWVSLPNVPLSLFGGAIGVIVGFRNNSAYGRWWEARTLWGSIVNNTRSIARQVVSVVQAKEPGEVPALDAMRVKLVHYQIAYVHALRQQLRGLEPWDELKRILPDDWQSLRGHKNIPLELQRRCGLCLKECRDRNWLDALHWAAMDTSLNDLADAQGGAERIKSTPMPKQYDFFPELFVRIYCLLLPLGLVGNMGWFTPLGSTLVGFMFLALDKIGRDLQEPFENTIYDVPLTAICTTIETNLRQLLGEQELPAPAQPVKGVLW